MDKMGKRPKPKAPKMVGYKAGGPTDADRLKMGRNMSRVANQRSNGRGK